MTEDAKKVVKELRKYAKKYRDGSTLGRAIICTEDVMTEAADMIEHLSAEQDAMALEIERLRNELEAAKRGGWISVEDRMPEEHDSIFAKFYGTPLWSKSMFRRLSGIVLALIERYNGTKIVSKAHTRDGRWCGDYIVTNPSNRITHWMPLPEPPKEDA